jgi:hypothetical protein
MGRIPLSVTKNLPAGASQRKRPFRISVRSECLVSGPFGKNTSAASLREYLRSNLRVGGSLTGYPSTRPSSHMVAPCTMGIIGMLGMWHEVGI